MKLGDPDLDRQLRAGVDRYDQLPAWMKEASNDRIGVSAEPECQQGCCEDLIEEDA